MSDEQQPPRIVERDRRRFTPDGKPRRVSPDGGAASGGRTEGPADPTAPPAAGSAPPPSKPRPAGSPETPTEASTLPEPPAAAATAESPPPPSDPRLQQLVFLLLHQADLVVQAAEAAAAQSEGPAAAEGAPPPPAATPEVLESLQSVIGMLEMLEEKTRGRLAPDDSRMLSRVLYQMRMDYIARVGPPGSPGAPGPAGSP